MAPPRSSEKETILLTGASGYLAGHILKQLLEYGFSVRATVRNQAAENRVKSATSVKHHASLTFVIIPDLSVDGAFDEAVKDVDGVIHTAAPFALHVEENERDLLIPSINGTTGILKAITKYNSRVKRVVITSSFAAMFDLNDLPRANHTYSERDWCSTTYEEARAGDGTLCYCASKALAEKAAWEYVQAAHPSFSISTIMPPWMYGISAIPFESATKIPASVADVYRLMSGAEKEVPDDIFYNFVNVRDVAEAHIRAYQADKSDRYFTTGGPCTYQQIVDIIREVLPEVRHRTPEGVLGAAPKKVILLDNSRAREELGINFTPLRETITDMARDLFEQEKTWAANRKG